MLTPRAGWAHAARMSSLIRALREAERAEAMALRLRREHGAGAEAVCEAERSRHRGGAADERFWSDVRRSLKWVKAQASAADA